MQNYADVEGHLPPAAVYGPDGKPLLSWRVLLLPYIEGGELFKELRLDEPWDSEHNLRLLPRMPSVYEPFRNHKAAPPHHTFYRAFVGKGAAFEGPKGVSLEDFPDGRSETFLVVEAGEAVPWTKPDELAFAPGVPLPKLGGIFPRNPDFRAAMADGTVRSLSKNLDEATLRALITRNGREELPPGW